MNEEEMQYLQDLEQAHEAERAKNRDYQSQNQTSMFSSSNQSNLIEWQLELDNILERVDHLLRTHELKFDEKGSLMWQDQKDASKKIFTDFGVQEILRILSMYLNRNTILSNYDEDTINNKVYDFGLRLSDLIYNKYEQIFYLLSEEQVYERVKDKDWFNDLEDTEKKDRILQIINDDLVNKTKQYEMIVGELVDVVHSAYLRALNGGERQSLREARHVTQTSPLVNDRMYPGMSRPQGSSFSVFKPWTWGGK